jgi:heat-inducible transcriptional repressor
MDLSKRARSVLYSVITEFVATGEPVGSRTLTRKYGFDLSPATIRNVLADLEESGLLVQPHTSAGRVPTEAAFRLFIDALVSVKELKLEAPSQIQTALEELPPGADLLREAGRLLSDLSGAPAIMLRSKGDQRSVVRLRFIPTRPGELLSVIVLSDGTVENRFIPIQHSIDDRELERLHNLLEGIAGGMTLAALRNAVAEALEEQRGELRTLQQLGVSLVSAALAGASATAEVIVEGRTRLLDQPEFASADQIRELMRALEDRERLLGFLDSTLVSERVQVFLGEETSKSVGFPVSVVAAAYREQDGNPGGAVGIIGPTRMDYPFVVPLVAATADAMTSAMAKGLAQRAQKPDPEKS